MNKGISLIGLIITTIVIIILCGIIYENVPFNKLCYEEKITAYITIENETLKIDVEDYDIYNGRAKIYSKDDRVYIVNDYVIIKELLDNE